MYRITKTFARFLLGSLALVWAALADAQIADGSWLIVLQVTPQKVSISNAFHKPLPYYPEDDTEPPLPYRYSLVDAEGNELYSGRFANPLRIVVDDFDDRSHSGEVQLDSAEVVVKIPALESAVRIRFEGPDGRLLGVAEMPGLPDNNDL